MRRRIMAALMTLLVLLPLAACGKDEAKAAFEELRASMDGASAEMTAKVTAFAADGTQAEYTLRCVFGAQGGEVETLAPELIAGVKAHVGPGSAQIEYEGLMLDAGEVSKGLSPVTALPRLCEAIREAHVELAWTEGGESVVSLVPEDETSITLRLGENGLPVSAEFTSRESGETLIMCRIEGFALG